jgi:hypothetical protein
MMCKYICMHAGMARERATQGANWAGRGEGGGVWGEVRARSLSMGCLKHSECPSGEYCAADFCHASDVRYPCARCSTCSTCQCDSNAVDNYCPDYCGVRRSVAPTFAALLASVLSFQSVLSRPPYLVYVSYSSSDVQPLKIYAALYTLIH